MIDIGLNDGAMLSESPSSETGVHRSAKSATLVSSSPDLFSSDVCFRVINVPCVLLSLVPHTVK